MRYDVAERHGSGAAGGALGAAGPGSAQVRLSRPPGREKLQRTPLDRYKPRWRHPYGRSRDAD